MGPVQAFKTCLRKYFVMPGRAPRSEYWWFMLAVVLIGFVAAIADAVAFGYSEEPALFGSLVNFLILCPAFTVSVRRLHDTGRSAWYLLIPVAGFVLGIAFGAAFGPRFGQTASIVAGIIVGAGFLAPLWWYTRPAQPGPNKYGPNPHEVTP